MDCVHRRFVNLVFVIETIKYVGEENKYKDSFVLSFVLLSLHVGCLGICRSAPLCVPLYNSIIV